MLVDYFQLKIVGNDSIKMQIWTNVFYDTVVDDYKFQIETIIASFFVCVLNGIWKMYLGAIL